MITTKSGGLGVANLKAKTLALLSKWQWRFLNEGNNIWKEVIWEFYGPEGGFSNPSAITYNFIWASIIKALNQLMEIRIDTNSSYVKIIARGSKSSFWHVHWLV